MTKASNKRTARRVSKKTAAKKTVSKRGSNGQQQLTSPDLSIKLNEQEQQRIKQPRLRIDQLQNAIGQNRVSQKKLQAAEEDLFRQLRRAEDEFTDACKSVASSHGANLDHPTETWNLDLNEMVLSKNP